MVTFLVEARPEGFPAVALWGATGTPPTSRCDCRRPLDNVRSRRGNDLIPARIARLGHALGRKLMRPAALRTVPSRVQLPVNSLVNLLTNSLARSQVRRPRRLPPPCAGPR